MAPSLLERQLLRTRNGLAHLAGLDRPAVAQTPRELVWSRESARLWRYPSDERRHPTPILIVHSLVSRSYILDLLPGKSMVRFLLGEGFDVFLLDWEAPTAADAENSLETYSGDGGLVPGAIAATCEEAGVDEVTLMGYCYGGVLALLSTAALADLPVRNLITLTTPCDFREMGFMSDMFAEGRLEADDVIDGTGLVPARTMDTGFQALKPTDRVVQQVNLWENLWNDRWVENFLAMNQWTRDHVPFPGVTFRQTVDLLIRQNALAGGSVPFAGGEAQLGDIRCPYLNVFCEKDTIVAPASSTPLVGLVGSRDGDELRLESGHVGLVAGSHAAEVALPAITDWVRRHSRRKARSAA